MGYGSSYYSSYPSNYDISAAAASTIIGALMVYFLIIFAVYVIQVIAMWKLYSKAGEKGWKSLIPIYNLIVLFKISGLSPWLILVYFAAIIPIIGWVAPIALTAVLCYKLAKSFGKEGGFAVGLYFLSPIFYMILAFGSSEYVGPGGESTAANTTVVDENTDNH